MDESEAASTLLRFKKISTIGFIVVIMWVSIFGGWSMVRTGSSNGSWGIALGIVLLIIAFTPPFRTYLREGEDWKGYPISIFVGNVLLILLYGYLVKDFALDPWVLYNDMNKFSLILWTGAILLSVASLVVNIIVFRLDRDVPNKNQTS